MTRIAPSLPLIYNPHSSYPNSHHTQTRAVPRAHRQRHHAPPTWLAGLPPPTPTTPLTFACAYSHIAIATLSSAIDNSKTLWRKKTHLVEEGIHCRRSPPPQQSTSKSTNLGLIKKMVINSPNSHGTITRSIESSSILYICWDQLHTTLLISHPMENALFESQNNLRRKSTQ